MLKASVPPAEDLNPQETAEWLQALDQVVSESGPTRASFLLDHLANRARVSGAAPSYYVNTPYVNTIPVEEQVPYPGDRALERRLKSLIRWNALAMVVRANNYDHGIGGHISTYASLATLVEVGFNHFSTRPMAISPGIWSISRGTPRRAFTRALTWRDGSTKSTSRTSVTSCANTPACPRTRILG